MERIIGKHKEISNLRARASKIKLSSTTEKADYDKLQSYADKIKVVNDSVKKLKDELALAQEKAKESARTTVSLNSVTGELKKTFDATGLSIGNINGQVSMLTSSYGKLVDVSERLIRAESLSSVFKDLSALLDLTKTGVFGIGVSKEQYAANKAVYDMLGTVRSRRMELLTGAFSSEDTEGAGILGKASKFGSILEAFTTVVNSSKNPSRDLAKLGKLGVLPASIIANLTGLLTKTVKPIPPPLPGEPKDGQFTPSSTSDKDKKGKEKTIEDVYKARLDAAKNMYQVGRIAEAEKELVSIRTDATKDAPKYKEFELALLMIASEARSFSETISAARVDKDLAMAADELSRLDLTGALTGRIGEAIDAQGRTVKTLSDILKGTTNPALKFPYETYIAAYTKLTALVDQYIQVSEDAIRITIDRAGIENDNITAARLELELAERQLAIRQKWNVETTKMVQAETNLLRARRQMYSATWQSISSTLADIAISKEDKDNVTIPFVQSLYGSEIDANRRGFDNAIFAAVTSRGSRIQLQDVKPQQYVAKPNQLAPVAVDLTQGKNVEETLKMNKAMKDYNALRTLFSITSPADKNKATLWHLEGWKDVLGISGETLRLGTEKATMEVGKSLGLDLTTDSGRAAAALRMYESTNLLKKYGPTTGAYPTQDVLDIPAIYQDFASLPSLEKLNVLVGVLEKLPNLTKSDTEMLESIKGLRTSTSDNKGQNMLTGAIQIAPQMLTAIQAIITKTFGYTNVQQLAMDLEAQEVRKEQLKQLQSIDARLASVNDYYRTGGYGSIPQVPGMAALEYGWAISSRRGA